MLQPAKAFHDDMFALLYHKSGHKTEIHSYSPCFHEAKEAFQSGHRHLSFVQTDLFRSVFKLALSESASLDPALTSILKQTPKSQSPSQIPGFVHIHLQAAGSRNSRKKQPWTNFRTSCISLSICFQAVCKVEVNFLVSRSCISVSILELSLKKAINIIPTCISTYQHHLTSTHQICNASSVNW